MTPFALDAMGNCRRTGDSARDIADTELDQHYSQSYGIFAGTPTDTAVLRFSEEAARWVRHEIWHPAQRQHWLDDGRLELQVPYSNPTELVRDVLSWADGVEVLAPASLRAQVRERIAATLAIYR